MALPEAWAAPTQPADARKIGGTEAGALLAFYNVGFDDLAKYSTAADVFMRLVHGISKPKTSRMSRGLRVEPVLRQIYEREFGPCGEPPGVIAHPNEPWFTCSPDGLNHGVVVEYKTTSIWAMKNWGDPLTDHVPGAYLTQCLWNCFLCDRPEAHLLVAFGKDFVNDDGEDDFSFTETRIYVVKRDAEIEARLVAACSRFVEEHLKTGVPPNVEPRANKLEYRRILAKHKQGVKNG